MSSLNIVHQNLLLPHQQQQLQQQKVHQQQSSAALSTVSAKSTSPSVSSSNMSSNEFTLLHDDTCPCCAHARSQLQEQQDVSHDLAIKLFAARVVVDLSPADPELGIDYKKLTDLHEKISQLSEEAKQLPILQAKYDDLCDNSGLLRPGSPVFDERLADQLERESGLIDDPFTQRKLLASDQLKAELAPNLLVSENDIVTTIYGRLPRLFKAYYPPTWFVVFRYSAQAVTTIAQAVWKKSVGQWKNADTSSISTGETATRFALMKLVSERLLAPKLQEMKIALDHIHDDVSDSAYARYFVPSAPHIKEVKDPMLPFSDGWYLSL